MTGDEARTLNHLRRLASAQDDDACLLARFLAYADAEAFAELVRRHGPMVLGVCRRVLGNTADADDAFQAAFIVLARKGHSVRNGRSVASFLFGVARFAALRARDKERRRREHEGRAGGQSRIAPMKDSEALAVLDEELQRLPDDLRAPLVACFLQGRTQEDAAKELGCSLSTLRRRLERGQDLLRRKLTGRGIAPALRALGAGAGVATVSAEVAASTAALVVATVTNRAGPVPATALAEGVIAMMARTRFKVLAAVLVAAGLICGGVAWRLDAAQPQPVPVVNSAAEAKAPPAPADPPVKPADPPPKPKDSKPEEDRIKPGDRLTIRAGKVLPDQPIDGNFDVEAGGKVALGFTYGRVKIDGLTLEEAEEAILKHLKVHLRNPSVLVTRYNPPEGRALELRVQQLEREVSQLKLLVNQLQKQKP